MKLILILGGARSGKSDYGLKLAEGLGQRRLFIATARGSDEEMRARIEAHRKRRAAAWQTLEMGQKPLLVDQALAEADEAQVALLDCVTLWVSSLMVSLGASEIMARVEDLLAAARNRKGPTVLVSNEVGLGLVPQKRLGRSFRDLLGEVNARLAAAADTVIFMAAGLPLVIKGSLEWA